MGKGNLDQFIDYWDKTICLWLDNKIESEQQTFFDAEKPNLGLTKEHMPEPYWGDPYNCSIVIANYNPGGGADRNRHTYKRCADWKNTFINEVVNVSDDKKYSKVVKDFPIIIKKEELRETVCWWEDYGGRPWWLKKMEWLEEHIIPALKNAENIKKKKPFAIEFCGWHSVSWPSGACAKIYENEVLKPVIDKYFIEVLTDAVKLSESKLGICVGAQFYDLLIAAGATLVKSDENTASPKYVLHLFEINDARILSIWGAGYNRYPKIDSKKLEELLRK